MRTLER